MAIIYSYPFDIDVQDADAWVGTNAGNRKTKQFTALAVAEYLNKHGRISVSGQMVYKLSNNAYGGSGTISLPSGGGSNFSAITSLIVSVNDISPQYVVNFLNYLVGSQILISEQNDVNNFGHYNIVSYVITANPNYYLMTLALVGSNGAAVVDEYYDMALFTLASGGGGSGVTTVDTSEGSFITLTPTTPTAGNVLITADLSATGTPDNTTYLRGDNTWASIPPGLAGSGTTNYVAKWSAADTLTDSVIYDNGTNVGIGTASPSQKLEVVGSIKTSGVIIGPSPFEIYSEYANRGRITLSSSTNTGANQIALLTDGSVKMVINKEGNVGIGTTSPTEKLEVGGKIKSSSDILVGTYSKLAWGDGNNYLKFTGGFLNIGYFSDAFKFDMNSSVTKGIEMVADSNFQILGKSNKHILLTTQGTGNVGIGTTSPNSKLDVRIASNGVALELIQTAGSANDFVDLKMIAGNASAGTLGTILRHKRDGLVVEISAY
jgi:hypothetical protein